MKEKRKAWVKVVISIILIVVIAVSFSYWDNRHERGYKEAMTSVDDLDVINRLAARYVQLKSKAVLTSNEIDEFEKLRKKLDKKNKNIGGELERIWKTQIR